MSQQPAKTYKAFFADVKARIQEAQLKTILAANAQMLLLYWQMGRVHFINTLSGSEYRQRRQMRCSVQ